MKNNLEINLKDGILESEGKRYFIGCPVKESYKFINNYSEGEIKGILDILYENRESRNDYKKTFIEICSQNSDIDLYEFQNKNVLIGLREGKISIE